MKNLYKFLFGTLLAFPFMLISCSDDYMETDKGNQPLTLSASESIIALDITAPTSNAITFEWTPGSNFNTNAAITYTFELGLGGTNFTTNVQTELTQGKNSVVYKTSEINAILLNDFELTADTEVEIEARVTAKVHSEGIQPQVSDVVKVKITTYKPVSSTLYILGGAAPNGWSADAATKMNTVSGAAGGFVWQGKLNAGELKFITTLGEFLPSYNKGGNDTQLVLRESDGDPDEKFTIPTTGTYKISVNIINLTIHIEALEAPEYGELWFVGGFSGWSFIPLTADLNDPFVFHYNTELKSPGNNPSEEFKIATVADFDQSVVFLRPATNGQGAGTDQSVVKWSENEKPGGENDYKWKLNTGTYKIKLDIRDMKIDIVSFTPYPMIYLVGDATPNGWSIDNATPMTIQNAPYIFTWTGTLKAGEMKFTCDKKSDWNGDWFLASQGGKEPSGDVEQMIFSANGSGPDNKWKINSEGTYTIELDQLKETVKFTKK